LARPDSLCLLAGSTNFVGGLRFRQPVTKVTGAFG
jgi:hypothetical protein